MNLNYIERRDYVVSMYSCMEKEITFERGVLGNKLLISAQANHSLHRVCGNNGDHDFDMHAEY